MQIYVLDRAKNALATTSDIYDDTHIKELTAGSSSYEFTIDKTDEAAQYMVSGNYIVLKDDQGKPWSFSILNYDETQTTKTVYAEDVGIELINKAVDVWNFTEAHPFSYYFDLVTDGTPWELGINQLDGLERTLTYTGRDTGLGRLLSVLIGFDNAECTFDIKMQGTVPIKYVVNVYKQIGTNQSNIQIVYGEEMHDIKKTESRADFVTALQGVGGTIQDTTTDTSSEVSTETKPEVHVDFADLEYNDGEYFTEKGDKLLRARNANQSFNAGDQGYVENFYEYDTQSEQELFNRTLSQLMTRSKPQFTYEADVKVIDPALDIGDTVKMIDHDYNPELYLQARISKIEKSYTDPTKGTITFTNYVVLASSIAAQLNALRDKVNGIKNGSSSYVWIRYADDDKGTGISQSPKDKTYVAILAKVNQPVPSDDPKDYVGHWVRIAGANGKDGQDAYLHIAYANSVDGKTDFTTDQDQAHNRDYLGTYSDNTKAQSTDPTKYTWQLTRGAQGLQGQPGSKDVPVVTMSSTAPPSPKNGDFWYQTTTDASGQKITGFSVYSGGKWVPSTIDQSVLVLTKLVSVEIDSATINSPDISIPYSYYGTANEQYTGSFEIKDGNILSISTITYPGQTTKPMQRVLLGPNGYSNAKYEDSTHYTANDPISVATFDDDGLSMKMGTTNTRYGITGMTGDNSINGDGKSNIGINFYELFPYMSDTPTDPTGIKSDGSKFYTSFDLMSGMVSHPNLIRNSSFINGKTNWDGFGAQTYMTNTTHDGNFAVCIDSAGGSNFISQNLSHIPDPGHKLCVSYWGNINRDDGGFNGGMLISFQGANSNYTCNVNTVNPSHKHGWRFYGYDPIMVPNGTTGIRISFFNNEHTGNKIYYAQPMINDGDVPAPYMPTY